MGASRLPAGIPSTVQHTVNAAMTSGPYFNGRTLLTVTILGCSAVLSSLRAWLRCQPVLAHNSSIIRLLPSLIASVDIFAYASDTSLRSYYVYHNNLTTDL